MLKIKSLDMLKINTVDMLKIDTLDMLLLATDRGHLGSVIPICSRRTTMGHTCVAQCSFRVPQSLTFLCPS